MAYRVACLTDHETHKYVLLTLLIVCDPDGEQFSILQTRIESAGGATRCGQIHAGIIEFALCDGIKI